MKSEMAQNAWSEWQAFDDVSGARLVPEKVAAARRDEIAYFKERGCMKRCIFRNAGKRRARAL